MYRKVLVPLDGSRESERVINSIQDELDPQSEVILLKVISPMSGQRLGNVLFTATERKEGERTKEMGYLRDVIQRLGVHPDGFRCEVVVSKSVAEGITRLAGREGVDLIAMYTHDRKGLARLIKGSVAAKVERGSSIEVRVIPPRELAEVGA
ncbi:MAG: universal stress protein [Nitrososphaerales archaeon]